MSDGPSEYDVTRVLVTVESGEEMPHELHENGAVRVAIERGQIESGFRLTGEGRGRLSRFRALFAVREDNE